MPILKNAIKQMRKDRKRAVTNLAISSDLYTLIKKTRKAIESKGSEAKDLLAKLQQAADKAVKKGIIKKNTTARLLSRLHARVAKLKK